MTFLFAGILAVPMLPSQFATAAAPAPAVGRIVPEGKFSGVGLADAIDFLRDVSGINIVVNWNALAEANVTRDTPVNCRLYNVSVRKVLNVILSEASGGTDAVTFVVDEGVVEITTKTIADSRLVTRVYPVDDLLVDVPDFDAPPSMSLENKGGRGGGGGGGNSGGGGGNGGGGGLFPTGNNGGGKAKEQTKTKQERGDDLVTLITSTIRPDVWRDNGGTSSIRFFNGNLIVSAPLSVHEQLGGR